MACEYCRWISGHPSSCPNAPEPKFKRYCLSCGNGICGGEEYIENDDGGYIHIDCSTAREMVEFLGYEIQVMKI